jgi:hypothetical protein
MNPEGTNPAGSVNVGGGLFSQLGASGNFGAANLIAGLIFSTLGLLLFNHGKREQKADLMILGGLLMTYCFFTPTALWTWGCGLGLLAAAYYMND